LDFSKNNMKTKPLKILFLLFIFVILISCRTYKIKQDNDNQTQKLIGNITKIKITNYNYPLFRKDTIIRKSITEVYFNSNNQIKLQIDKQEKYTDSTFYFYKNKNLQKTVTKNNTNINSEDFFYDNKNNIIKYIQIFNGEIYFIKESKYDIHNNPIEQTYTFPKNSMNDSREVFEYNYKKLFYTVKSFKKNSDPINTNFLKTYFNKDGYIIKTEFLYEGKNKDYSFASNLTYDTKGNLQCRKGYLINNNMPKQTTCFKNVFDKKGNIIISEKYVNDKLLDKQIFEISYK